MNRKRASKAETHLAALVYLSRALDDLSLPIRIAEDWVRPVDLPEFLENIEKHVRALAAFIDDCLEKHSVALVEDEEDNGGTARILEVELADARKNLAFLNRIGKAGAKTDTGKSTALIVREEIRRAVTGSSATAAAAAATDCGSATDFSAEAEELRKLRNGEFKTEPPTDSKRPQP